MMNNEDNVNAALLAVTAAVVGVLSFAALGYAATEGFTITFETIEPTTFNTLSAFFSVVSTAGFGLAVAPAYKLVLSWSMRLGNDLPVSVLGTIPGSAVNSLAVVRALKCAFPVLLLAVLFVFADLAHTFGDLGLDFVTISVAGPEDTVLNLGKRNSARLIETAGDPTSQTKPWIVQQFDSEGYLNTTNLPYVRKLYSLIDDFLLATDLIARSGSPFVSEGKMVRWNVYEQVDPRYDVLNDGRYPFQDYFYGENNTFLNEIPLEIPLNCESYDLVEVDQFLLSKCGNTPNDLRYSTALVPNCYFSAERPTGIFGEQPKTAAILESAHQVFSTNTSVLLKNGTDEFQMFNATPDMRDLARDRSNWKSGRTVPGITGLRIGTHLDIDFGTVVLAGGTQDTDIIPYFNGPPNASGFQDIDLITQANTYYLLVADVAGTCPQRPSGFPATDTTCYATVEINCPSFPEDSGFTDNCYGPEVYVLFEGRPPCFAIQAGIHWGKGFEFDAELAAVVAGMYGRVKPPPFDTTFVRMASLAGIFATASLDFGTSTTELVRPKINSIFVAVRLIPFFLIAILLLVVAYFSHFRPDFDLPIPQNSWQLLELGSKEHQIIAERNVDMDPSSTIVLILSDGKNKVLKLHDRSKILVPQTTGPVDSGEDSDETTISEEYEA